MSDEQKQNQLDNLQIRKNYLAEVPNISKAILRYWFLQSTLANPGTDTRTHAYFEGRRGTFIELLQTSGEYQRILGGGEYEALPKISFWRRWLINFLLRG